MKKNISLILVLTMILSLFAGITIYAEEIPLNTKGRYIKIVSKGNSVNKWMNILEMAFTK